MENLFELHADLRGDRGKGASRRLRRAGKVPAILYGAGEEAVSLVFDHNLLFRHLSHEAFYSHILTIHVNGKNEKVVLKALQRSPINPNKIVHLDLQRVSAVQKLSIKVPLHFIGHDVALAIKQEGGIVAHLLNDVEVSCFAKDLPEYIEVDLTNVKIGETLHLSDLKLPAGVEIPVLKLGEDHNQPVVAIHKPKSAQGDESEAAG
ncbi:50S ribosomal protein L25 [Candidatus Nitrosoglobus terrae]|uniref:Large ribosomal subunit protein bL25 n=1 Tax=Candidatus Nitrosoglobus terrae TaxID=1630141 RepID=A0A1Q2SPV6_9GAMM|nr:50S ribosomal protein L25/general stress protein Ctc [Candidatus Nitrosoglobus terrae]BAW81174.1 50S ribosomal protein L25 [Candidatus Nitrosoglobus terrae]